MSDSVRIEGLQEVINGFQDAGSAVSMVKGLALWQ